MLTIIVINNLEGKDMTDRHKTNKNQKRYTHEEYLNKFLPSKSVNKLPSADSPRELGIKLANQTIIQLKNSLINHKR